MRAQTSLPVLGVALVLVVVTALFTVTVADGQLAAANSNVLERQSAAGIAEHLVASDSPATVRSNVVRAGHLSELSVNDLRRDFGLRKEDAARVVLDGTAVLATGSPAGGATVERIVLVETRTGRSVSPRFDDTRSVTLPRRTPNVSVSLTPSGSASVETVRSNGDVVLHDPAGLAGTYEIDVSRFETATLTFQGAGNLSQGDVEIAYWPAQTKKASLQVTVRRWGDSDG